MAVRKCALIKVNSRGIKQNRTLGSMVVRHTDNLRRRYRIILCGFAVSVIVQKQSQCAKRGIVLAKLCYFLEL